MTDSNTKTPDDVQPWSADDVWDIADEVSRRHRSEWPTPPQNLHPRVRKILSEMKLIYFVASMHPRIGGNSEGLPVDFLDAALFEGLINITALVSALIGKEIPQDQALNLDKMQREWEREWDKLKAGLIKADLLAKAAEENAQRVEEADDGQERT